jgi:DNA-binding MarR family transcriptional regulator
MQDSAEAVRQAAVPRSKKTLESYTRAFPDADLEALSTHLSVASMASLMGRGIEAKIRELGFELSRPRYSIVRALYLSPGHGLAQSDLAQALNVSGPNVTQLIDGLVADGWVERVVSSADRRVVHACLTPEGEDRAARLVPAVVDFMVKSCDSLTAREQADLRQLLAKVRVAVESLEMDIPNERSTDRLH